MTKTELNQLPTNEILSLFNKATGRTTKKFASRAKGIEQTAKALKANGHAVTPKSKASRRSSGMSFRLAPKAETKTPRTNTKRAKVLDLISAPPGALFSTIQKACGWNLKDAYEGVRLLNVFCGFGLWHEEEGEGDYRIWEVDAQTFAANVRKANG
jgi:hypothetical protein